MDKRMTAEEVLEMIDNMDISAGEDSGSDYEASATPTDDSSSSDGGDLVPVPRKRRAQPRGGQPGPSCSHPQPGQVEPEQPGELQVAMSPVRENIPVLRWSAPNPHCPIINPFTPVAGVSVDVTNFTPIALFSLFLSDTFFEHMVTQTNLYAEQFQQLHGDLSVYARARAWEPANITDMKKFWGLTLAMGMVRKPTIETYWSTHPVFCTPLFPSVMNRNRYQLLLRFLHFNDNQQALSKEHPHHDHLYKVRPLIEQLSSTFPWVYTPTQNISVDESLLLYKGRLVFKQYLPLKRARYGIKLYKLCESSTGYTHRFRVYVGKDHTLAPPDCPPSLNKPEMIVWDLLHPLLHSGYHLYVDNFYTGIPLFRSLYMCNTLACGTIRKNRKGYPTQLVARKQKVGESSALHCDELLAVRYTDKKDVYFLTTIHSEATQEVTVRGQDTPVAKPLCVLDYNKHMGGVDRADQMLQSYDATRKTMTWYKKLAVYFVQMAIHNAFVLHKSAPASGPTMTFLEFQMSVIASLLFEDATVPQTERCENVVRLTERHFPAKVPPTAKKANAQKRCRVCYKKGIRRDSRFHCPDCPSEPGLCVEGCFGKYHKELVYWSDL